MRNIFLGFVFFLFLTNCGDGYRPEQARMDSLKKDEILKDSIVKAEAALAKGINLNTNAPADKKFVKTAELKFKVSNVLYATMRIEELCVKYGGYTMYSNLQNSVNNDKSSRISRDSILHCRQIVVENNMNLRVPNAKLDSFVRELNPLVVFFDYRVIKMDDVTYQFMANQKKNDRMQKYEQRQMQHIDQKPGKITDATNAEDQLLEKQNQADDLQMSSLALADQVTFCNLNISIYQKPIIVKETVADFDYASGAKTNFFPRIWDSVVQGWGILAEVVIFLVKIWGVVFLILALVFGINYVSKWMKKKN
jgi:hypothetical protein